MARRRRKSSGSNRLLPTVVLIALLLGAGWWVWDRHLRESAPADPVVTAVTDSGGQSIALPPARSGSEGICGRLAEARVATLLDIENVTATTLPAEQGVPRAAGCEWRSGKSLKVRVMWFNDASLTAGGIEEHGSAYFSTAVTGLEYALKLTPERLSGIGDEAVAAGFETAAPGEGQLIARQGQNILVLESSGASRAATGRLAGTLLAQL